MANEDAFRDRELNNHLDKGDVDERSLEYIQAKSELVSARFSDAEYIREALSEADDEELLKLANMAECDKFKDLGILVTAIFQVYFEPKSEDIIERMNKNRGE